MLQTFLDNLKEKKTTVMGIVGLIITALVFIFPGTVTTETGEEIKQTFASGYDLLETIVLFILSVVALFGRIFPKKP